MREGVYECIADGDDPEAQRGNRKEHLGPNLLTQQHPRQFQEGVSDVEDGQDDVVIVAHESQLFVHARNLGVADVGTIDITIQARQ